MSTQTTFDLNGLIQAIESSDTTYQVALYAEHAELEIADGDTIGQAPYILAGRPAIARWIDFLAKRDLIHHITHLHADRTSLSFVDELHGPQGMSAIHRSTAEISAGQITRQTITLEARVHPSDLTFPRRPSAATTMRDDDPDRLPRAWARPLAPTPRHLAGNFLG